MQSLRRSELRKLLQDEINDLLGGHARGDLMLRGCVVPRNVDDKAWG
jgi:hypothetical protein